MALTYELNTRCWLRELGAASPRRAPITLAGVPESEFQRWRDRGFTHIWLMGVWTSGPRSHAAALAVDDLQKAYGSELHTVRRTDIVGSPYSISGYQVPAALGGNDGLRRFRKRLHEHGLKLLLDFVPNHLGLDHPWLDEHPDRFVNSPGPAPGFFEQATRFGRRWIAHGKDPFFPPWTDTAQLDYRNPETRAAMLEQLLRVADECDGVRCDMAMLLLNDVFARTWNAVAPRPGNEAADATEFWSGAISRLKARFPQFIFVAEVYWGLERRLQELGFDFTYNKELYDELMRRDFTAAARRLEDVPILRRCVHFLENHDEQRVASRLDVEEHRLALLLLMSLPGMRLLHEGQLSGARFRVPVQIGCRVREPTNPEIASMYEQILKATQAAQLGNGQFQLLRSSHLAASSPEVEGVIGIQWWRSATDVSYTLLNFGGEARRVTVPLDRSWTVHTLFRAGRNEETPADLLLLGPRSGVLLRARS